MIPFGASSEALGGEEVAACHAGVSAIDAGTLREARDVAAANAALIARAPDLLAENERLREALEDAEFLMRKAAIHPQDAAQMVDSFRRSATAARAALEGGAR